MDQKIAVIDYNAGNIRSMLYALERLSVDVSLTSDPDQIFAADKVIFPGVGEASTTMQHLNRTGLSDCIRSLTQPVFAVCIGQQLVCAHSEEGHVDCLGIFDSQVKHFDAEKIGHKVPHMGWNQIYDLKGPLFKGIDEGSYVYFVHSYYVEDNHYCVARCDYGNTFAASMQKDNFFSTQFHPEKSAKIGAHIIQNFLDL